MDSPTDQAPHISTTYPVGDTCASTGRQLNKPCLSKRRPPPATCTACSQSRGCTHGVDTFLMYTLVELFIHTAPSLFQLNKRSSFYFLSHAFLEKSIQQREIKKKRYFLGK